MEKDQNVNEREFACKNYRPKESERERDREERKSIKF